MVFFTKLWAWVKKYWQFLIGGLVTIAISLIARGIKKDSQLEAERSRSEMKDQEAELFERMRDKEGQQILDTSRKLNNEMNNINDDFDENLKEFNDRKTKQIDDLSSGPRKDIIEGLKEHLKE